MTHDWILVVEPEELAARRMADLARECGVSAVIAGSSLQGLKELEQRRGCCLVLSRAQFPGERELSALDWVSAADDKLAVVLCASEPSVELVTAAFRAGAADVIAEPLTRPALASALARSRARNLSRRNCALYVDKLQRMVIDRTSQLRELMADLERSYDVTIEVMGDALDLRDEETNGHSKRVTAYAIALARAMRLSGGQVKTIGRGAFLHDVGKIAIPDAILLKPGRLTQREMAVMRTHCVHGYNIVRKIPFLSDAAEIVYAHQEHFDGTGYPRGLAGRRIPLGARIFALVDALDAITSDRPYRKASSFERATHEITKGRGRQFDPEVVDAFLGTPHTMWPAIRTETGRHPHASGSVRAAA